MKTHNILCGLSIKCLFVEKRKDNTRLGNWPSQQQTIVNFKTMLTPTYTANPPLKNGF